MAKKSNNYFELIKKQTSYCVEASNLLEEILCKFHAESINAYRTQMHEIEHTADEIRHDILNKLSTEFITPIDQDDILRLVQIIDDITDGLDEAAGELKNFKKPGPLHALLVRVNDIESEADTIYTEAIHSLFGSSIDYKTLLGAKTVYEGLEHCCDLCEHAADVIEQIVIKNT